MDRERASAGLVSAWIVAAVPLGHFGCGAADGDPPDVGDGDQPLVDCAAEHPADAQPTSVPTVQQALRRASFSGIGDLPGGDYRSEARDVDAHGGSVVGVATSAAGIQAVRWTREGGLVALDDGVSEAFGISDSGCVVVGSARTLRAPQEGERPLAARWVGSAPIEFAPEPLSIFRRSEAIAVSADGHVILGMGYVEYSGAGFSWRGSEYVDDPPYNQENVAADEDGSVVVGLIRPTRSGGPSYAIRNGETLPYPFREDPECTAEPCPPCITPGVCVAAAYGVSADGSIVVGSAAYRGAGGPNVAVQWVVDEDAISAMILSSGEAIARAVSADGRVVVGAEGPVGASFATRWVDGRTESLTRELRAAGVSLDGWQLTTATGVSSDGQSIVGVGINPDGNTEGWVARLPVY